MTDRSITAARALLEAAGIRVSAEEACRLGAAYDVLQARTRELHALTESRPEGECLP